MEGTVGGLSAIWPALRQLLLSGAVHRLCEPAIAGSPDTAAAAHAGSRPAVSEGAASIRRMQELGVWVARLLGAREKSGSGKQGKAGAKRKSMAGADGEEGAAGWSPGPEQARELLGSCLRALAVDAVCSSTVSAARASAVESAAAALLQHCGGGARLQQLLKLAAAGPTSMQPRVDEGGSAEALVDFEGSMAAQRKAQAAAEALHAQLLQRQQRAPESAAAHTGSDR